ncbi:AtpZ/AtpI family protein [Maribacter halichondriae]|uniref:AtpZ/AtpI family protein n=1 Tax=Maribacter halichondriae TaxID=2980554 RepID=UPI002358FED6|nr:AtpZ/AtpI family protein [Maribacter sp. Hal144]
MKQQKPRKPKSNFKNFAVLSGIAFEMGAIIFLAAKGGLWLDDHNQNDKKIYTAIATLLGVAISLYVVLQQLKRLKN